MASMNPIDLLTQETIELHQRDGIKRVPGHRYQDFAVHRAAGRDLFSSDWRITHLPTGRQVATGFKAIEPAVEAMIEIARLRNDWAVIADADLTEELAEKCEVISERHGGYVRHRQDSLPRQPVFNGYRPEQP